VVIDPDESVEVIGVRGTRVLVRRGTATTEMKPTRSSLPHEPPQVASAQPADTAPPAQLDFDMPQG
jgi:hypothetical protein